MTLRRLVIVGAGGHGREVLDVVEAINSVTPTFDVLGFVADGSGAHEPLSRRKVRILGPTAMLESMDAEYVVAIGDPAVRAAIDARFASKGLLSPVLIHPLASVGSDVHLGAGSVAMAGSRFTTNVVAGRHFHANTNATVSHDCRIGDYVTLSPGCHLSGDVHLDDFVYLGTGAVVIPGIHIGAKTMVGAGAVVIRDLPPNITAVGVPARAVSRETADTSRA